MTADDGVFEAAIFDLDGLLIDSEPIWRRAEIEVFGGVGLRLTEDDCRRTMGLRVDDVVDFWRERRPWDERRWPAADVVNRLERRVEELIERHGEPLDGAVEAVALFRGVGLRLGLASSSPSSVIEAALRRLGLGGTFRAVVSALDERRGKPDPAVYLTASSYLRAAPARCIALEDSPAGVMAARDAGMFCIAVPDRAHRDDPAMRWAEVVLGSLVELDAAAWERIRRGETTRRS